MPKKKTTTAKKEHEPIMLSADSLRLSPLTFPKLKNWSAAVPFVIELQHPDVILGIGFTVNQLRNLATEFLIACEKFEQYTDSLVKTAMYDSPVTFKSEHYI